MLYMSEKRAQSDQSCTQTSTALADQIRPHGIAPIASLDPSMREWTIKGKVTWKGERTRFRYARGEGIMFSFDLLDEGGGEVQCTCYNTVANRFFDRIHTGRAYRVSNGTLKAFQAQTQNLNQHQKQLIRVNREWEITLGSSSVVEPCAFEVLQHGHNLTTQILFPKPTKFVKDRDDGTPVGVTEEPITPQGKECRRIPVQDERSMNSKESEQQEDSKSAPSSELQESKEPKERPQGAKLMDHLNSGGIEDPINLKEPQRLPESRNFNSSVASFPSMTRPEVRDTACGDSDVRIDDTDVQEWIGGPGEPANPSSYKYAWPTGWD